MTSPARSGEGIEASYAGWAAGHPDVVQAVRHEFAARVDAGAKRISVDSIVHVVREQQKVRIKNAFVRCLSDHLRKTYPQHTGLIRTGKRIAARQPERTAEAPEALREALATLVKGLPALGWTVASLTLKSRDGREITVKPPQPDESSGRR